MPRAERDLVNIFSRIQADTSEAAHIWYFGLEDAIASLAGMPERNPVTPERSDLRHLLYGNKPHVYRVIYRIDPHTQQVSITHIRHGAQRPLT